MENVGIVQGWKQVPRNCSVPMRRENMQKVIVDAGERYGEQRMFDIANRVCEGCMLTSDDCFRCGVEAGLEEFYSRLDNVEA